MLPYLQRRIVRIHRCLSPQLPPRAAAALQSLAHHQFPDPIPFCQQKKKTISTAANSFTKKVDVYLQRMTSCQSQVQPCFSRSEPIPVGLTTSSLLLEHLELRSAIYIQPTHWYHPISNFECQGAKTTERNTTTPWLVPELYVPDFHTWHNVLDNT